MFTASVYIDILNYIMHKMGAHSTAPACTQKYYIMQWGGRAMDDSNQLANEGQREHGMKGAGRIGDTGGGQDFATGGGARCMLNHLWCAVGPLHSQQILNYGVSWGD